MHYTYGNSAVCKHSKGRNIARIGKASLAVYATCKSPRKIEGYRSYHLENVDDCHNCDRCQKK